MSKTNCRRCRVLRAALLSVLCGSVGGFGVLALGGSSSWSMAATFLGAMGPVLWLARQPETGRQDATEHPGRR